MITIKFKGRAPVPCRVDIGMETDHNAETLRFELPQIAEGQTATLQCSLPGGLSEVLTLTDGECAVTNTLTATPGKVTAWVEISVGTAVIWHSELMYMIVGDLPAIGEQITQQMPTALQDALTQTAAGVTAAQAAQTAAEAAQGAAESAAQTAQGVSSHPPMIGANGNWYTWNEATGAYADTGLPARGPADTTHAARTDNPHGVTAAQIGAAAELHQHAFTDVPGLSTALDGKQSVQGNMALIEEITLTEAAAVARDQEPDGTPYSFSALVFHADTSGAEEGSAAGYFSAYGGENKDILLSNAYSISIGGASRKSLLTAVSAVAGRWISMVSYTASASYFYPKWDIMTTHNVYLNDNANAGLHRTIRKFTDTHTYNSGTVIRIYGVRV